MIRTLPPGVGPSKTTGLQTLARSATGSKIPVVQRQSDHFHSERTAHAPVRFAGHLFFGKTNAEKEADQAEHAWLSSLTDSKTPDETRQKQKSNYDEAKRLAERTVKLKKHIQQAGGILGAGLGAGAFAMTGTFGGPLGTLLAALVGAASGAYLGHLLMLPIAHYTAEAVHAIRSPEFKKGYNQGFKEARAKG